MDNSTPRRLYEPEIALVQPGLKPPLSLPTRNARMTFWKLILRSLRFHARAHVGVILGAAVGSGALIGALVVGDSVRGSLRQMALARLGRIQSALAAQDRFFRARLAADLQDALASPVVSALQLPGTAARSDGTARANQVQILGVDARFWDLASQGPQLPAEPAQGVVLNSALARQLQVQPGETVLLRVQKPSLLSRESPVTPQEDFNVALRLPVRAVVGDEQLGLFSLRANQVPPYTAFLPLSVLQAKTGVSNQANLLLVGSPAASTPDAADPAAGAAGVEQAQAALRRVWQLADLELELRRLTNVAELELRSRRVFLEAPVVQAVSSATRDSKPVLTYFVNELRCGDRSTPYSMVTGLSQPVVPDEMGDDEILLNPWLAEDLQAKPGDQVELTYSILGQTSRLELARRSFRVRGVVPLQGVAADPELMPDFPGVAEAENSREWQTGFPIDLGKIRDKDEQYWKQYRGTPKAFVTIGAAQEMWANRFGTLTALRFAGRAGQPAPNAADFLQQVRPHLDPAAVGLLFQPVRAQALAASAQSLDFGQLFLGFSFFLIVAALVLMALLFQFGLEQRAAEIGTLLALGFTPGQVRRLVLAEGTVLALAGGIIGLAGGAAYARAMLYGLATIWRQAVGTSALSFHATPTTLFAGLAASVGVSALTIALVLRKQARQPARELLAEGGEPDLRGGAAGRTRRAWFLGIATGAAALAIVVWTAWRGESAAAGAFFGAGSLCLISGLAFGVGLLGRLERAAAGRRLSLTTLGLRGTTRRRRRSLATVALLACGSFLVVAVGANKLDARRQAEKRSSGTGGFALIGQSALPVVHDLNAAAGRDFFGLDPEDVAGMKVVPFRVREGDDASCLNLNRAQTPRLLGVNPALLQERSAFTFAKLAQGCSQEEPWLNLNKPLEDAVVPAIGDQASIEWALDKKLGDTLAYTDERGRLFKVRLVGGLANSILQGNLVIAESEFVRRFPGESGYRLFLIDAPLNRTAQIAASLSRALQDVGLELVSAPDRLAAFNAVQNTYLRTFQILGGLGLLLGSAGLGVVVLRNVLERRGELGLLQAVGFHKALLRWLVLSEHVALLAAGLGLGIIAALVAVLPALLAPGAEVQVLSLGATLAGVFGSGLIWTLLATSLALRGRLLDALRGE